MELAYAFFANGAEFVGGRLFVLGGDFDTIRSESFPTPSLSFALVVKLAFTQAECNHQYRFRVELKGPRGKGMDETFTLEPPISEDYPERGRGVGIVTGFPGVCFASPGEYTFRMFVDDKELKTLILHLEEEKSSVPNAAVAPASLAIKGGRT